MTENGSNLEIHAFRPLPKLRPKIITKTKEIRNIKNDI